MTAENLFLDTTFDVLDCKSNSLDTYYFKSAEDRTVIEAYNQVFDSLTEEYFSLVELQRNDPDHFAVPYLLKIDSDGEPEGYYMSKHTDRTLSDVLREQEDVDMHRVSDQIYTALQRMEDADLYHGDLSASNVLVDENSDIRIIDPIGSLDPDSEYEPWQVRIEDRESIVEVLIDIQEATGLDIVR